MQYLISFFSSDLLEILSFGHMVYQRKSVKDTLPPLSPQFPTSTNHAAGYLKRGHCNTEESLLFAACSLSAVLHVFFMVSSGFMILLF